MHKIALLPAPTSSTTLSSAKVPQVWVLLGQGAGGNGQMLQLAKTLNWPYETKQLRYNPLNHLPNLLLGASAIAVDRRRSDSLVPPWPDLVIAASRRAAPVARWIKQRSGGHTRLVHLLHTQAPLHYFDLVVTFPQYRLPQRPNVLHNTLPWNIVETERLAQAAAYWQTEFAHLPQPWIAVLVGGNSSSYKLSPSIATQLGKAASLAAKEAGGSLLITTSPRTPPAAAKALLAAVKCPAYIYCWQPQESHNPYLGFLALASRFIVTADSASLAAEACATGRPVQLFEWPTRQGLGTRLRALLPLQRLPWWENLQQALIYWGLFKPRRDFHAFHRTLIECGLLGCSEPGGQPPNDLERTVARIHQLMGDG